MRSRSTLRPGLAAMVRTCAQRSLTEQIDGACMSLIGAIGFVPSPTERSVGKAVG